MSHEESLTPIIPKRIESDRIIILSPPREKDDENVARMLSNEVSMQYLSAMSKKDCGGWTCDDTRKRRELCTEKQNASDGWFAHILIKKCQREPEDCDTNGITGAKLNVPNILNLIDVTADTIHEEPDTILNDASFAGTV